MEIEELFIRILGQYENSVNDYTQAIQITPDIAWYYNDRGVDYEALGQYDKAISDCTKAIQMIPNYGAAYNNRGKTYQSMGQSEKAVSDYTNTIRINPGLPSYMMVVQLHTVH